MPNCSGPILASKSRSRFVRNEISSAMSQKKVFDTFLIYNIQTTVHAIVHKDRVNKAYIDFLAQFIFIIFLVGSG